MPKPSEQKLPIGALLTREGLLTEEQLAQGLAVQKSRYPTVSLGRICVNLGFLSEAQLGTVLSQHHGRLLLGELLEHLGLISAEQVQEGLAYQKSYASKKKLGAVLIEKGWLDEKALIRTLYKQAWMTQKSSLKPTDKFSALILTERLSPEQLEAAMTKAYTRQRALESILEEDYKVPRKEIGYALAAFYQCPFVSFNDKRTVPLHLVTGLNQSYLKANYWVPLTSADDDITILIDDPHAFEKLQDVRRLFPGKTISCAVGLREDIVKFIESIDTHRAYKVTRESLAEGLQLLGSDEQEDNIDPTIDENHGIIVRLVNQLITDAYKRGASDIHIEPEGPKDETCIRFRVDGQCHDYLRIPAAHRRPLVSRLKIMSHLDIAERRKPQDGKIKFRLAERDVELRVAVIPTAGIGNEDVVLRLLVTNDPMRLEQLHMTERNLRAFNQVLEKPYGLVLCVGPTGSGKTTTLHAALAELNIRRRKIWTAEDPVEVTQRGLRQVQVNPKIGFTFAAALRAFLRADPDIIMVGEIRDQETAEVSIEASLTGHLVLSTLHTNNTAETVTRLLEMGLDPFNFADSLLGVLAQRLARTICASCKRRYHPGQDEYDALAYGYGEEAFAQLGIAYDNNFYLYRGKGCKSCHQSGYRGRIGLHELLIVTDELKRLIHTRTQAPDLLRLAMAQGTTTLVQDGILKVLQGLTDYKQVKAVAIR